MAWYLVKHRNNFTFFTNDFYLHKEAKTFQQSFLGSFELMDRDIILVQLQSS
jgi:hypothetical protein